MGGPMGAILAFLMLASIIGVSHAAPPLPSTTKRSDENIQFGNQQNKPVSVLDEDALPGAFPSSETIEPEDQDQVKSEESNEDEHHDKQEKKGVNDVTEAEDDGEESEQHVPPVRVPSIPGHLSSPLVSPLQNHPYPQHREEMIRDLPPVALASRWRIPSEFYDPHWARPISPLYGAIEESTFPVQRRRRRSPEHPKKNKVDPQKVLQVSLHALRTGHRHKRQVNDIRRIRRDLNNIDLDKLMREVDVIELLAMLAKKPQHHNTGYGTVTYAPMAPAPPRFAPQPKLFPDYDEDEGEEDNEADGYHGMLGQSVQLPSVSDRVMMPSEDRIWRRSGAYSLSQIPGFKRSAFRANTPAPPVRALTPGDVYSLAAMLGAAELDPVTHRLRRAAM